MFALDVAPFAASAIYLGSSFPVPRLSSGTDGLLRRHRWQSGRTVLGFRHLLLAVGMLPHIDDIDCHHFSSTDSSLGFAMSPRSTLSASVRHLQYYIVRGRRCRRIEFRGASRLRSTTFQAYFFVVSPHHFRPTLISTLCWTVP